MTRIYDTPVSDAALDQLFRDARTHNGFTSAPVTDADLKAIFDLAKMAPTSANSSPARYVFVRSAEAKEKLRPALAAGNLDKTMAAPVTVIIGHDTEFHEHMPFLFPHTNAKAWFEGNAEHRARVAFQNGTLQVAYFILAARALGFDTGPMTGFDNAKVDAAFFAGTHVKSNVLVNLGHGDATKLFGRSPRFAFDQVATIL